MVIDSRLLIWAINGASGAVYGMLSALYLSLSSIQEILDPGVGKGDLSGD